MTLSKSSKKKEKKKRLSDPSKIQASYRLTPLPSDIPYSTHHIVQYPTLPSTNISAMPITQRNPSTQHHYQQTILPHPAPPSPTPWPPEIPTRSQRSNQFPRLSNPFSENSSLWRVTQQSPWSPGPRGGHRRHRLRRRSRSTYWRPGTCRARRRSPRGGTCQSRSSC